MAADYKHKKKGGPKWQSNPDDAIKLAAIRWFAATIEATSIQMYATNPSRYKEIEAILKACLGGLGKQLPSFGLADADCPPGFVLCRDNLCSPMCEWEPPAEE